MDSGEVTSCNHVQQSKWDGGEVQSLPAGRWRGAIMLNSLNGTVASSNHSQRGGDEVQTKNTNQNTESIQK